MFRAFYFLMDRHLFSINLKLCLFVWFLFFLVKKLETVLPGISMPGDDELLAETKLPQKRDDWMTTLPPERKVRASSPLVRYWLGLYMHFT